MKKILSFGWQFFCGWHHKWGSFQAISTQITWSWARTVARKFSIGGLCISARGLWACARGLDTQKINKNSTDLYCFMFPFGGLELFLGGLSPQKPPMVTWLPWASTVRGVYFSQVFSGNYANIQVFWVFDQLYGFLAFLVQGQLIQNGQ